MTRAALVAAALACAAGCADRKREGSRPAADPAPGDAAAEAPTTDGEAATAADPLQHVEQLVVVVGADWDAAAAEIFRFERVADGPWKRAGGPWRATLGRSGMGWGRGLLTEEAPTLGGGAKVEGDGRTPAGVFALGGALGYDAEPPARVSLPYQQLSASWRCVDDSESEHYNRVFDARGIEENWKSAEVMRRDDELYRYVILIDHNDGLGTPSDPKEPQPRAGSCIFFHVWRNADAPTVGCVAMERARIEELMRWLSPNRRPTVAILPRAAYDTKREAWGLPGL